MGKLLKKPKLIIFLLTIVVFSTMFFYSIQKQESIEMAQAQSPYTCGNNITEPGEACDGSDINGYTCSSVAAGFKSGTLSCKSDCSSYDVSQCIQGNTINALSCGQVDVQAAIDNASDGDTVLVPAGSCVWTVPVILADKGITIQGSGIDNTTIVDNTTGDFGENPFRITGQAGKPFRITGFTFTDTGSTIDYRGVIFIEGTSKNFRVDHSKFIDLNYRGITVRGYTYGSIDNNIFSNLENQPIAVSEDNDVAWSRSLSLGTTNAVYIEDNTFDAGTKGAVDAYLGARYVFRYNTLNTYVLNHGREDPGQRSTFSMEIYNNTFSWSGSARSVAVSYRGGTGVVFNNTIAGNYVQTIQLKEYCLCTGQSATCSYPRCTTYPCTDQVGRSTGQVLDSIYEWSNTYNSIDTDISVSEFAGCNDCNASSTPPCAGCNGTDPCQASFIKENRDYYNDVQKPGYIPYVYPHPLTLIEVDLGSGICLPNENFSRSGTDVSACSCEQVDVQNAIDEAVDGETVLVPEGECIWNSEVEITKPISVIGQNTKLIVANDLSASNNLSLGFFYIHSFSSDLMVRVSGFDIDLVDWNTKKGIYIWNVLLSNLRIDHNSFNQGDGQIFVGGSKGVIDNNYFYNSNLALSYSAGSDELADASWENLDTGTNEPLFIENNYFIDNNSLPQRPNERIGTFNGGKLVVRYNNWDSTAYTNGDETDYPIMTHGNAIYPGYYGQPGYRRGQSIVEIYNNTIAGHRIDEPFILRGSSNLIHDNVITTNFGSSKIMLREEECDGSISQFDPQRTEWSAEDQVHNTFIWNNKLNGNNLTSGNIRTSGSETCIQEGRDYFMHSPEATGGKEIFTDRPGAAGSYPSDGSVYNYTGTMIFVNDTANAYYPYAPYIYPHPLTLGVTNICGEGAINSSCWCEGYQTNGSCDNGYYTADNLTCSSADLNCSQSIDINDLATLKNLWGQSGMADLNQDDITDTSDFAIMMSKWGNY